MNEPFVPNIGGLHRFIRSRSHVPIAELRRRFDIGGQVDDVSSLDIRDGRFYVGLPPDWAQALATLVEQRQIGLDVEPDPAPPLVLAVYPLHPSAGG